MNISRRGVYTIIVRLQYLGVKGLLASHRPSPNIFMRCALSEAPAPPGVLCWVGSLRAFATAFAKRPLNNSADMECDL